MGPSLFISKACPAALAVALQNGLRVFEAIAAEKILQSGSSCAIVAGSVVGACQNACCVVKSYQKHRLDEYELQQVNLEVQLHQQLENSCVVPFWATVDEGAQLHIIMQYCQQSDLRSLLSSGPLSEAYVRDTVVIPLLKALTELHAKGYVHRDVKPDNVFMACDSALLGDFSLAVGPLVGSSSSAGSLPSTPGRSRFSRCSNDSTSSLTPSSSGSLPESNAAAGSADSESELGSVASLTTSRCSSLLCRSFTVEGRCHAGGTPAYCAPEVVLAAFNSIPMSEALGPHNDIWSLGILTTECLLGSHPYGDEAAAPGAVMHSIIGNQPLPLSQLHVTAECKDWLAAALAKDPRQRWSANRLLQHAWITAALPAGQQQGVVVPAAATVLAGKAGRAPVGHADCWDEGWHAYAAQQRHKQQQQTPEVDHLQQTPAQRQQQPRYAGSFAPPPWAEDDWVSGLDRLSSQLMQCRQQEQQDKQRQQQVAQQCQLHGITSWED